MLHRLRLSFLFSLIPCILILSACSEPKLKSLDNNATILAFGDSLTFGVGAKANNDYPSVLSQLTGLTVINAGISGETTFQGVKRFEGLLVQHNPELVILLEGGNDILRNLDLNQTKQNLAQMIKT